MPDGGKYNRMQESGRHLPRGPVGPAVPDDVISVKLELIRMAMVWGDQKMAMHHCSSAFDEVSYPAYVAAMPLSKLRIPLATINLLERHGYLTIGDVVRRGVDNVAASIPYLGKIRVAEIKQALSTVGFE